MRCISYNYLALFLQARFVKSPVLFLVIVVDKRFLISLLQIKIDSWFRVLKVICKLNQVNNLSFVGRADATDSFHKADIVAIR